MTEEEIGKINRKLQKMIDKTEVVSFGKIPFRFVFNLIDLGRYNCTRFTYPFARITYYT